MLRHLVAAHALAAGLAARNPATPAPGSRDPRVPSDSAAEIAILAEMRAFYRDLDDRNWTALLDHFLPAKVTARWSPPLANAAWRRLEAPPSTGDGAGVAAGRCAAVATVAVVGDWARLLARRCSAPVDEAWFLRVQGHWKIVHLGRAGLPVL